MSKIERPKRMPYNNKLDDYIDQILSENKELKDGLISIQIEILEMEQSSSIDTTQILNSIESILKP